MILISENITTHLSFPVHPGRNHIDRSSHDSSVTVPDIPSFQFLKDRTQEAIQQGKELHIEEFESGLGLPNRFLIPKGNSEGLDMDLVVAITDGEADAAVEGLHETTSFNHYGCADGTYPDNKPHGYPLDRRVDDERIFENLHNFKHIQVKVFHRS